MKKRSPVAVLLLPLVTFSIYFLYWLVKTKGEMNERGAGIPTAWLLIIPFVNIWWYWKYCQGVEHTTGGKLNGLLAFLGFMILSFIMAAIVQDSFNHVDESATAVSAAPAADAPMAVPAPEAAAPTAPNEPPTTPVQ